MTVKSFITLALELDKSLLQSLQNFMSFDKALQIMSQCHCIDGSGCSLTQICIYIF
jgi:hypothetical protein